MTPGRPAGAGGADSERRGHPADPTQLAVDVAGIKGTLALFQQQLSQGMQNNTSALGALQADVRELGKAQAQVASLLTAMESHSQGLGRAFTQIGEVARGFHDWREAHETKNERTADTVTTWRGVIIGLGLIGTLLCTSLVYIVESRFAQGQADRIRLEVQLERSVRETDARLDVLERHP
jgi:hypothetical protein